MAGPDQKNRGAPAKSQKLVFARAIVIDPSRVSDRVDLGVDLRGLSRYHVDLFGDPAGHERCLLELLHGAGRAAAPFYRWPDLDDLHVGPCRRGEDLHGHS